jgi:DNA-binding transcriptional regulator GbsR (MarR family)
MSAKTRHDLGEISKKNICSYIYNNPASMVQIKEATGLSLPYIRLILIKLSNEYMVRESKMPSLGRRMTHYESFSEYTPKEYARKPFLRAYAPLKKLGDDFVSEVLNRLSSQSPKIVAIDLDVSLSKIYYVRRYYGSN